MTSDVRVRRAVHCERALTTRVIIHKMLLVVSSVHCCQSEVFFLRRNFAHYNKESAVAELFVDGTQCTNYQME